MKEKRFKIALILLTLSSSLLVWHQATDAIQASIPLPLSSDAYLLPTKTWAQTYPDGFAYSATLSKDGGYAIAGIVNNDAWVFKLDDSGNVVWQKTYGGSGFDSAYAIATLEDGGFLVGGQTRSFGPGTAWVFRIDSSGNLMWEKIYNGNNGLDWIGSISQTVDGGYILAGSMQAPGPSDNNLWVFKLDSSGNIIWSKTYGGNYADYANAIVPTADGGFVVGGVTNSFGAGGGDVWILKLDEVGNIIWQKTFGGSDFDEANAIVQTTDGGYVVAGDSTSVGIKGAWVFKLDAMGNIIWQNTFGKIYDGAYSILQTSDGGYMLAGKFWGSDLSTDYGVIRLNASGNIVWQKMYGGIGNDGANSIMRASDGGYIIVGNTGPLGPMTSLGVTVLKTNAIGLLGGSCSIKRTSSINVLNSVSTLTNTTITPAVQIPTVAATSATVTDPNMSSIVQCSLATIQDFFLPFVAK